MATRLQSAIIPVRFLTMLGHLLAVVLFFFARRDNIVVSLPFLFDNKAVAWFRTKMKDLGFY